MHHGSPLTGVAALKRFAETQAGGSLGAIAAAPGRPSGRRDGIELPNGETYYPRAFEGTTDVDFLIRCVEHGNFVSLLSAPGTGKSAMLRAAIAKMTADRHPLATRPRAVPFQLVEISCSEGMDESALVGRPVQDPGSGVWSWDDDGTLAWAMRHGLPTAISEASAAAPAVLTRVNNVFDGQLVLRVMENRGDVIAAADGFWAAIDYNPGIRGFELSPALESRFGTQVEVFTNYDAAIERGVNPKLVNVARRMNARLDAEEVTWAPQMRELVKFQVNQDTFGERFAVRNLVGQAKRQGCGEHLAELLDEFFEIGSGTHPLEIR